MEKNFNYIYITTNLINGHQYIGDRSCDYNPYMDLYLGSGILFLKKKKEYGNLQRWHGNNCKEKLN